MKYLNQYLAKEDRPYALAAVMLGFINHFLYDLSGGSAFIALFCPVNESVWEHLKLLFFPILLVSIPEYLRFKTDIARFFYCRFLSVLCAMASTVMLFYTYTGIIGQDFFIIDIFIFISSILFSFSVCGYCCQNHRKAPAPGVTFSMWAILALLFFIFTCFPPNIPLFFPMPPTSATLFS